VNYIHKTISLGALSMIYTHKRTFLGTLSMIYITNDIIRDIFCELLIKKRYY